MLPLCLAAAALKLTRPPSLSHAEVDQLVAQRTRLRSVRDFAAADALKETLESAGVRLQDEVRGRVDMYAVPRSALAAAVAAPSAASTARVRRGGSCCICLAAGARARLPPGLCRVVVAPPRPGCSLAAAVSCRAVSHAVIL